MQRSHTSKLMLLISEPTSAWWRTPSDERRQYRRRYDALPDAHAKKLARQKAYYRRHRERRLSLQRTINHGCTPEAYAAMWAEQDGKCASCGRAETGRYKGKLKSLAVDHDHATGRIRALLCQGCNKGIGSFGHDPDRLRAAVIYLLCHLTS